jgi:hypothetical protein
MSIDAKLNQFGGTIGGSLSDEENSALYLSRVFRKLDIDGFQLKELGLNEKMALIEFLAKSVVSIAGN